MNTRESGDNAPAGTGPDETSPAATGPDETARLSAEARAQLAALDAQVPSTGRVLATWGLRVAVLAIAVFAVMRWRDTDMAWFVPLVAIYAAISLTLSLSMLRVQRRAHEKGRAKILAALDDLDKADHE